MLTDKQKRKQRHTFNELNEWVTDNGRHPNKNRELVKSDLHEYMMGTKLCTLNNGQNKHSRDYLRPFDTHNLLIKD